MGIASRNNKEWLIRDRPAKLKKKNHYVTFKISLKMGFVSNVFMPS